VKEIFTLTRLDEVLAGLCTMGAKAWIISVGDSTPEQKKTFGLPPVLETVATRALPNDSLHKGFRLLSKTAITVRRERRWSTAGDKPARELDRSTR
jgi:hypothetical protein